MPRVRLPAMTWILALAVAGLAAALYLIRRDLLARLDDVERTIAAMSTRLPEPDRMVAEPPTVSDRDGHRDTVYDHLVHHTLSDQRWADVVRAFYGRVLAEHPRVVPYFHGVKNLEELQVHFTRALIMVTKEGLKQKTVDHITKVHANVHTPDGTPITGEIYDEVIEVLIDVLVGAEVPVQTINQLARTIEPLRAAIVAPESEETSYA